MVSAEIHAVLLAGSHLYYNYRHQADICHAYHVLIDHGVKPENIITMAYDDIANNSLNPYPGKIFNKPDGNDVYAGCVLDYTGDEVTPENFVAILTGNSTATGGKKVLNSTAADDVFINFADHGGAGLVAVINEYLYADQLINALKTMHDKKMYNKLLFYMEACEAGSMFTHLPNNLSILAHTAANPDESSFGCYCHPDDSVNGKYIGSCLGDTWSVSWMEDSDSRDLSSYTVNDQYNTILKLVTHSHPTIYGDLSIGKDNVSTYQGENKKPAEEWTAWLAKLIMGSHDQEAHVQDSRKIKLSHLKIQYERNPTLENMREYHDEIESIEFFDTTFKKIDQKIGKTPGSLQESSIRLPEDLSCLRAAVKAFERDCAKFSDYGLKYTKNLAHLCYR